MSYAVSPTMSDDERDIDIESDDDDQQSYSRNSGQYPNQVDKRAHHNALERKRRDHIKDSFSSLRDSVPSLHGEKASRAQILKKAADYIQFMRRKNVAHQQDIEDLKKQNEILLAQIRSLEKAKSMGSFGGVGESSSGLVTPPGEREAGQESDHSDDGRPKGKRTKKTKFAA